jgi:hypothetical protein
MLVGGVAQSPGETIKLNCSMRSKVSLQSVHRMRDGRDIESFWHYREGLQNLLELLATECYYMCFRDLLVGGEFFGGPGIFAGIHCRHTVQFLFLTFACQTIIICTTDYNQSKPTNQRSSLNKVSPWSDPPTGTKMRHLLSFGDS